MPKIQTKLLSQEYWWGGQVEDGIEMPFGTKDFERSLDPNTSDNQASPFLVSSKGRYVISDSPINFSIKVGILTAESTEGNITLEEGFDTLRKAYKNARKNHFPGHGQLPDKNMFKKIHYSTWIELMHNQQQEKILEYANSIISNGLPAGVITIDDGWQEDYGVWNFHPSKFPNPKKMIEQLNDMGFNVMLWTSPFISPDSSTHRELAKKGYLVRKSDGSVAVRKWWNGYSSILDFSNPDAVAWYDEQNQKLVNEYGIDGFKFEGGDATYYKNTDITTRRIHPNEHCRLYALYGQKFKYNIYRTSWKCAQLPLVQRICDKKHSWDEYGLGSLIPNGLAQGLLGYTYTCPDMIGGGESEDLFENPLKLEPELFVRFAQCSALFPAMQFSAAFWSILDEEHASYCHEAAKLHQQMSAKIIELAEHASKTGEPIIRHMDYVYPGEDFEEVNDQFMLGDDILVAPVLEKGAETRTVKFPKGIWHGDDKSKVEGPCTLEIETPVSRLPWYTKSSK